MASWTVGCQAPLFMEFLRQEYWSRLPFPTPGDLLNPGIKAASSVSPTLTGGCFTSVPWEARGLYYISVNSVIQLCPTLCDPMDYSMLGFPVHHQLPELPKPMSTVSVRSSNHLILCCPLLLLPSIFPSIRVFSNESALCIRWSKYWEFQLQHQSFQWTPKADLLYDGLVGSPCSPRDSQESSPTPEFKSINSLVLSFLYDAVLTFVALTTWTFAS